MFIHCAVCYSCKNTNKIEVLKKKLHFLVEQETQNDINTHQLSVRSWEPDSGAMLWPCLEVLIHVNMNGEARSVVVPVEKHQSSRNTSQPSLCSSTSGTV